MSMNRKTVILFASLFISIMTPELSHAGWVYGLTVKGVRSTGSGDVTFSTVQPPVNPQACPSAEHYVVPSTAYPQRALSVLLVALLSGKSIDLYFPDSGPCVNGRPTVSDVNIGNLVY